MDNLTPTDVFFKSGDRVRYIGDNREIPLNKGAAATIVEVGDVPSVVFKDPKCSNKPLAFSILPDDSKVGPQIVYPTEIELK